MQDTISVVHKAKPSDKPFAQVVEALEAQLGHVTMGQMGQIVQSSTSPDHYAEALQKHIGPSGFIVFGEFDHGPWMSMFYKPIKARLYVLGNPLFAKDLLMQDAAAGLYVPTRLCVYEDERGVTQLAYDRLADFARQFHNPLLTAAAELVDQKLDALVALAAG